MDRLNYRVNEACQRLSIGRSTFYELVARGEIRLIKIGARSLVPAEELDNFQRRLIEGWTPKSA